MTKHISDDDPLVCPKCAKTMEPHSAGDVAFERCTGCAGLWMNTTVFEKLMSEKSIAKAIDTGDPEVGGWTADIEGALSCPRDGSRLIRMVNHRQPQVHYESCKTCGGVFLDAGELRDMASHSLIERLRAMLFGRK